MSLFTLFTCSNKKMEDYKTKKVKYDVTPSAADGYPCRILPGSMVGYAPVPYGHYLEASWGEGVFSWAVGDPTLIAPDTVFVEYYSITDDKFYRGIYPMDQEKLYSLLSTKYKNYNGKEIGYYSFTMSVGTCGWVSLWIDGSAGSLEAGSFRAKEVEKNFERIYPHMGSRAEYVKDCRADLPAFVQKEIAEKRLSSAYWERLATKYKWKLVINDSGFEVYNYDNDFINAERRLFASSGNWLTELNEKPIPLDLCFFIRHDRDPLRYKVWIKLVKTPDNMDNYEDRILYKMNRNRQLLDLFDRFYSEAGNEEVSLYVELSKNMKSARLLLKTATKEQEIPGCFLRGIFNSDEYDIDR